MLLSLLGGDHLVAICVYMQYSTSSIFANFVVSIILSTQQQRVGIRNGVVQRAACNATTRHFHGLKPWCLLGRIYSRFRTYLNHWKVTALQPATFSNCMNLTSNCIKEHWHPTFFQAPMWNQTDQRPGFPVDFGVRSPRSQIGGCSAP